jgi:plasmid maintenance system antidote protein VapI
MTAPVREKTKEINREIIEAFYEEGLSVTQLAVKFGRSTSQIHKLLALYKLSNPPRERTVVPRGTQSMEEKTSLSLVHAYIGLCVDRYMGEHELGPTAFGMLNEPGLSRVMVKDIVVGARDLTICQVQVLAGVLGIPYEQLMNPPQNFLQKKVVYAPTH